MIPIHQYVDNKTGKRYYYSRNFLNCESCDTELDFVVLHLCWGKQKSYVKKFCFECSNKTKQESEVVEKIPLMVVNKKPKNSKLILISQPEFKNSSKDDSIFCNTIESNYIDNRAKRSGHPDYTVLDDNAPAQIGLSVDVDLEAEKDKLLESDDELDLLLAGFKDDTILIGDDEDEDKKLLE